MLDKPSPTDEQLDILNAAGHTSSNMMIEALAGTGKTSTLELLAKELPSRSPILYLVFNKKNAEEAKGRMPAYVSSSTFNSQGHRIWASTIGKSLRLDAKKTDTLYRALIEEAPKSSRNALWEVKWEVQQAVSFAKALGYLPPDSYPGIKPLVTQGTFHSLLEEEPDDLVSDLIDTILTRSIRAAFDGLIDYNDQVYMPALFRATCPQFATILVDEYQDLAPANHALLAKLARGRLIGVGDPNQNIYGFRGAKAGGMEDAIRDYAMDTFPLSVSFRCPSAIVKHVHWHVPKFKASQEGGNVSLPTQFDVSSILDGGTIISRNNAPVLRMAFNLLRVGRSVSIAGSEIGPKLINMMRKLGPEEMSQAQTLAAIYEWEAEKLAKESKTAEDMAGCMRVFAEQSTTLGTAIAYAEHLFRQQGTILLTTIHKAKGLEWNGVYHLDPWMVRKHPSSQNKNLDYVCSTRSSNSLTEIDFGGIIW
jgi:DNA helicase-2/ATP-dependent DNA helicase PcrA